MKIKILCVILAVILTMSAFAGVSVFAASPTKNVVKTLKIEDFEGFGQRIHIPMIITVMEAILLLLQFRMRLHIREINLLSYQKDVIVDVV